MAGVDPVSGNAGAAESVIAQAAVPVHQSLWGTHWVNQTRESCKEHHYDASLSKPKRFGYYLGCKTAAFGGALTNLIAVIISALLTAGTFGCAAYPKSACKGSALELGHALKDLFYLTTPQIVLVS